MVAMICVHCKQVHEVVGRKVSKHHKKEERCALITKLLLVAFLAAIVIHVDDCGQVFECFYFFQCFSLEIVRAERKILHLRMLAPLESSNDCL